MFRQWLDAILFRGPFRGRGARRYLSVHRPAFGDLDERLIRTLGAELTEARVVLDLGAGDGRLARRIAGQLPGAFVLALEPSPDMAMPDGGAMVVRGFGERLPLRDGSVDVAILLSSVRHVWDRRRTLVELRRVVHREGTALIIELDPAADTPRAAAHVAAIPSPLARLTFVPVLLRLAPPAEEIAALAIAAGWRARWEPDPLQPFYWMWLT